MSVRRSLLQSYSSQAITFLFGFVTSIVAARLLGPPQYGVFALASSISALLGTFVSFGTQAYLVREKAVSEELLRTGFSVNALINLILCLIIWTIAWIELTRYHERALATVLFILGFSSVAGILEFIPSTLYMRAMGYGVLSAINVVRAVTSSISSVILLLLGYGPASLALGQLAASVTCAVALTLLRWNQTLFRPSFRGYGPVLSFGLQIVSISGVAQMAARASDIVLARFLGVASLGLYGRASALTNLIFTNVYGAATSVIFVQLSRELNETGSMHVTFTRSLRMIIAAMWPLVIGVAILAGPAIRVLYGPQWSGAATPLALMMIGLFVVLGFGMNWELFVLRRETARQTRFEVIRALTSFGACSLGSLVSVSAAASGRIVDGVVGYFLYRPLIDRMAGTERGELERLYAEGLLLTATATGPCLVLMGVYRWSSATPLPMIACSVAAGILLWVLVLQRRAHPLLGEWRVIQTRLGLVRR